MKEIRVLFMFLFVLLILPVGSLAVLAGSDNATKGGSLVTQRLGEEAVVFMDAVRPVSFSQDIQPIFNQRCVFCHGPDSIAGSAPNGLLLDTYDNVILGSLFLPVVQAGQPDKSTIILLLRSGGMPAQGQPLPEYQIRLIEAWIAQGARNN